MTKTIDAALDHRATEDVQGGNGPFASATVLRGAHAELLKTYRQQGVTQTLADNAADFLIRASATGAILDDEEERWEAQEVLDYWSALLFRHGHSASNTVLQDFAPMLAPVLPDSACPYMGLHAFGDSNSRIFFGRDALVRTAMERLESERLLAVMGPSGSGKSSLVLAGLIPALRKGAMAGSEMWRIFPRRAPGAYPLRNLARLLTFDGAASNPDLADATAARIWQTRKHCRPCSEVPIPRLHSWSLTSSRNSSRFVQTRTNAMPLRRHCWH